MTGDWSDLTPIPSTSTATDTSAAVELDGDDVLLALARKAAVADMTSAILHELASSMQSLYGELAAIDAGLGDAETGPDADPAAVRTALGDAQATCTHVIELYRAARSLLHGTARATQPFDLNWIVPRAVRLCSGMARGRSELCVAPAPREVIVRANRVLLLQVAVAMLRSVISRDAGGDPVTLRIDADADTAFIEVTGSPLRLPGRIPELADLIGLHVDPELPDHYELACARYLLERLGGTLHCDRNDPHASVLRAELPRVVSG
jgi:hypothetical protein